VRKVYFILSLVLALCIVANSSSHAAIYTGTGPGESTIGTGGDYASLNAACEAINNQPLNGGDWTFLILNDLDEPANPSILQDELHGNRITLRPAPGTSSTVTFTTTSVQSSFRTYGHLTIGAAVYRVPGAYIRVFKPTHNFIIDGCNVVGGTERNLTFRNIAGAGARTLIAVQGNCDNFTLKNCNLTANGVYQNAANLAYGPTAGIDFVSNIPLSTASAIADYPTVENCFMQYLGTDAAAAISINTAATIITKDTITSAPVISDNHIVGHARGIHVIFPNDAVIARNRIEIPPITPNPYSALGIYAYPSLNSRVAITSNTITFPNASIQAGWEGIAYACWDGGSFATISNNSISGMRSLGAAPSKSNIVRYGIRADVHKDSTATLSHNSIDMYQSPGDLNVVPFAAAVHLGGLPAGGDNARGLAILRNNILRTTMRNRFAITSYLTSPTLSSNYNNLFVGPESYYGQKAATWFTTLTAWQAAMGLDQNSISQDPYVSAGPGFGTWAGPMDSAAADLHFTSYPGPLYLAPPLFDVTHDIDGDVRNPTAVVIGADEMEHPNAAVDHWSIY